MAHSSQSVSIDIAAFKGTLFKLRNATRAAVFRGGGP
jgi:hypothetical protein